MRAALLPLLIFLCSGCASAPPGPPPRTGETSDAAYWVQDESYAQARAVALSGTPSPTPELDALAALASATTPQLGLAELLSPAAEAPPATRLRPGDGVELTVYGREEFSGRRQVGPNGTLPVFLVGAFRVEGMTEAQASTALGQALRAHVKQAQVHLFVSERAPIRAHLIGRVRTPGALQLPHERRLDLTGLLALGGGLAEDADGRYLALLRADSAGTQRCYHFSYEELIRAKLAGKEVWILPDDELVVPRLDQAYVYGAVGQEGSLPLRQGTTVAAAILAAGGLGEHANARGIQVIGKDGPREAKLEGLLRAGDVVFVPQRQRVYVVGEGVETPGAIDLPASGLSVMQAIAEAGWFKKHADTGGVQILRWRGGRQRRIDVPVNEILAGERSEREFELQPGDLISVPEAIW